MVKHNYYEQQQLTRNDYNCFLSFFLQLQISKFVDFNKQHRKDDSSYGRTQTHFVSKKKSIHCLICYEKNHNKHILRIHGHCRLIRNPE